LTAPSKKLVWFENSGHEPFVDEPGKFNATIAGTDRVPPAPQAARWPRRSRLA
jgi:pimeloyl-ACP methyl ester carboxylesterase